MHSPLLPLRHLAAEGDVAHLRERAERAARAARVGKFFSVDLDAVRRAFESLPWVRKVEVRRLWPDRIEVSIEEHVALARWNNRRGAWSTPTAKCSTPSSPTPSAAGCSRPGWQARRSDAQLRGVSPDAGAAGPRAAARCCCRRAMPGNCACRTGSRWSWDARTCKQPFWNGLALRRCLRANAGAASTQARIRRSALSERGLRCAFHEIEAIRSRNQDAPFKGYKRGRGTGMSKGKQETRRRSGYRHLQGRGHRRRAVAGRPAEHHRHGRPRVKGLKKGVVVNIEATVSAIQRALEEAELMADCKIHPVLPASPAAISRASIPAAWWRSRTRR